MHEELDIESILDGVLSDEPTPAPVPKKAPTQGVITSKAPQPGASKAPVPGSAKGHKPVARVQAKVEPEPEEEEAAEPTEASSEAESQPVFTDTRARNLPQIAMPTFIPDDLAAAFDIRNFASIVVLNTGRWHAKVKDRRAAKDAALANDADENAFDAQKRLLVGADEKLKKIHKVIDAARIRHYEMTLPWTTTGLNDVGRRTGGRLLPNTLFFEYTKEMAGFKHEMQAALDDFVPEYPSLVDKAKGKLGKRFDPREYPNADAIRSHFVLSFDFQPIPQGADFKGLPDQQLAALARHINANTQKMMENAMQDVWLRLRDAVAKMAERLSAPDKLFHYTLVDNVRSIATLLNHLNVTSDARIENVRKLVEKNLCPHDVKDLRENSVLRTQVAAQAQTVLDAMDSDSASIAHVQAAPASKAPKAAKKK